MPRFEDRLFFSQGLGYVLAACVGTALGAATMALLDPTSGRRRRAAVGRSFRGLVATPRRTPLSRLPSLAGETGLGHAAGSGGTKQDVAYLLARVHAALGRLCEDAHAIEVRLCDGVVELHGEVHRMQRRRVVQGVRKVWGVGEVRSFLHVYDRHAQNDDDAAQVVVH